MAPTSKNANPAPDYTVLMNRVQSQFESQISSMRSMLPPRSANSPNPLSFSALTTNPPSNPSSQPRVLNAESLFSESSADPNTGLGFGASAKPSDKERDNQILRKRLVGKGRRPDGQGGRREKESSDEEEGRSGLGRSKKKRRVEDIKTEIEVDEAVEETADDVNVAPEAETKSDEIKDTQDAKQDTKDTDPAISKRLAQSKAAQKRFRKRKREQDAKRREKEAAASEAAT
ncbi:hypothetical protein F5Y18DRAFT_26468 [Xylariaceae sp. FL1019]|nr:hypothetical protein F5Y18DRAFT_26468 [Xylariaceae sp. FL1019]